MPDVLIQPSLALDENLRALAHLPERITGLDASPVFVYDPANVPAAVLPWLADQFNVVGPLWRFLPDEAARRAAVRNAVQWHRAKGTPWAVTEALRWIGLSAEVVDEYSTSNRWAEYELRFDAPPSMADMPRIVELARFAAPARAHLVRMFDALTDVRPIRLDHGPPLDVGMLDNDSGVWIDDGGVKGSFGVRYAYAFAIEPNAPIHSGQLSTYAVVLHDDDSWRLDAWALDSEILLDAAGYAQELIAQALPDDVDLPVGSAYLEERAAEPPTPDEADVLPIAMAGDTNACQSLPETLARWGGPWGGPWREAIPYRYSEET